MALLSNLHAIAVYTYVVVAGLAKQGDWACYTDIWFFNLTSQQWSNHSTKILRKTNLAIYTFGYNIIYCITWSGPVTCAYGY